MLHFIEEQVEWTKEKYTLTSFKEKGHFKLPTLIQITSGYFGKDDSETFSSDDVLVLYEWKLQERVLARRGKVSISIPLDIEYGLEVLGPGKPAKLMFLSQIVQNYKPPVKVRFGPGTNLSFTLGREEVQAWTFGTFTLMSSHYLEYVTASTTVNGMICTEELVCLPIYRQVRFGVATHLHGVPMDQQRHYFHSFLDHMETTLTLGILEYTELLDCMEEYDYIRTIPSGTWGKPRNNNGSTSKNTQYTHLKEARDSPNYETVETQEEPGSKLISQGFTPAKYSPIKRKLSKRAVLPIDLPERMKRDDIYYPVEVPTSPLGNPKSINVGEIDQMTLSSKDVANGKQRPIAPISPRTVIPGASKPPRKDLTVVPEAVPPLFPRGSTKSKAPSPVSPKPLNPISNKPVSPSWEVVGMSSDTSSWMTSSAPNMSHPGQSPSATSFPMPIPMETKSMIADSTPVISQRDEAVQEHGSSSPTLVIHCLGDVPADLSDLSVDQVCQCLGLLNLGEFSPRFRQALIDGRVLKGCSVDDLKQEFSMGHLSARKLAMFVNDGWRPKE